MNKFASLFCCFTFPAACGGGSGIDPDEVLNSLSTDERIKVCEYIVSELPAVGEYTCSGETT